MSFVSGVMGIFRTIYRIWLNSEGDFSVALTGSKEASMSKSIVQNSPFCFGKEGPWL